MNDITRSGRLLLRLPRELHASLARAGAEAGISLNELCVRRLRVPPVELEPPLARFIERVNARFAGDLVGIVIFGSWARGDATAESDVDALVVVEDVLRITRSLYTQWEGEGGGHEFGSIEPHFVHLPRPGVPVTGLWAEVAIDGIVLFDRALRVSRALGQIRRRIARGELVRRWAHGHPYWAEVA
jgi:hypothetical protein